MATIYERVDALELTVADIQQTIANLQTQVNNLGSLSEIESDIADIQNDITSLQGSVSDSGWLNLPLTNGILSYADIQIPQYRKIGNTVFVKGAVKNVLATGVIGTLPEGYRPTTTISFIQNTSLRTGNFPMFARYTVNSSGVITLEGISDGASFGESKWFPIMTSFTI